MTWFPGLRPARPQAPPRAGGRRCAVALVAVGTAAAITTRATVAPTNASVADDRRHQQRGQHAHGQPRHVDRLDADHVPVPVADLRRQRRRLPRHRGRDAADLSAEERRRRQHGARPRDREQHRRLGLRRAAPRARRSPPRRHGPDQHRARRRSRAPPRPAHAHRERRHVDRRCADHVHLLSGRSATATAPRATTSPARPTRRTC